MGRSILVLVAGILCTACTAPTERLMTEAARQGYQKSVLSGGDFRMTGFFARGSAPSKLLHVYLEGDGVPWDPPLVPATDPTPRKPVMFRLMSLDPSPALYLGRPCYDEHVRDAGCSPALWTSHRYSDAVVAAMADALTRFVRDRGFGGILLFGHSGGGAMALLLATRLAGVRQIVTLAALYDTDAWTAWHGYAPLTGSLNPSRSPATGIPEWHFLGADDRRVPAPLMADALRLRSSARVEILPDHGHACCWETLWRQVLRDLSHPANAAMFDSLVDPQALQSTPR